MNRSVFVTCLAFLWLGALPACSGPVTRIVVQVDTDLVIPDEISSLRVSTYRANADVAEQFDWRIFPLDGPSSLPMEIAVLVPEELIADPPPDADDGIPIIIQLEASGASDRNRVITRVETRFRDGASLSLPMYIAGNCRRVTCPMGSACGMMGCVPQRLDSSELLIWEGDSDSLATVPPPPVVME